DALMRRAWAQGLTALRGASPPSLTQPLRVVTQRSVPTDGISEAGPASDDVAALFAAFTDVELLRVDSLQGFDPAQLPHDGRLTVLASNQRERYPHDGRGWKPDLHLVLWNPFQALDIAAPTVVTWGYAEGALA